MGKNKKIIIIYLLRITTYSLIFLCTIYSIVFSAENSGKANVSNPQNLEIMNSLIYDQKKQATLSNNDHNHVRNNDALAATVKKKEPSAKVINKSEDISFLNERILDIVLKRLDNTIFIFGSLMTLIVAFFGIGLALAQKNRSQEIRNQFDDNSKNINDKFDVLDGKFENFKKESLNEYKENFRDVTSKYETMIETNMAKIPELVRRNVEEIFKKKYDKMIPEIARNYADDALMLSPESRDTLYSTLRSTVADLTDVLAEGMDKKITGKVYEILGDIIQDWHTLGQIYSPNKEQLKTGLLSIRAKPINGADKSLKRLAIRYSDDVELSGLIFAAIKAIERKGQEQVNNIIE